VRQAYRNGARVYIVGGAPSEWAKAVSVEVSVVADLGAVPFSDSKKPVIVCGTSCNTPETIASAAQAGVKTAYLFSGPNACGAALLAKEHGTPSLAEALATGKVKGILSFEADIPLEMLEGVPFVAAADWRSTDMAKRADIFLPTTSWVEMDGTYVNNEGRAQRFRRVMNPGLPIKGLDPDLHPPRIHSKAPPGSDLLPAWMVIARLMERLGDGKVTEPLSGRWEKLRDITPDVEGIRIL
jgi:NADH-quinone oxidoreductase subunit G